MTFGFIASLIGGDAQIGSSAGRVQHSATGLKHALLIMLVVMIVAGALLVVARRFYPRDVATALRSEKQTVSE